MRDPADDGYPDGHPGSGVSLQHFCKGFVALIWVKEMEDCHVMTGVLQWVAGAVKLCSSSTSGSLSMPSVMPFSPRAASRAHLVSSPVSVAVAPRNGMDCWFGWNGRRVALAVAVGLLMAPLAVQAEGGKPASTGELQQMLEKAKAEAKARGSDDEGFSSQSVREVQAGGAVIQQGASSGAGAQAVKGGRAYQGVAVARLRWFAGSTPKATGTFVQTQLAGGKSGQTRSTGSFAFLRPGHFRWQIDKPDPQLIVTDGKKLHFYDEGLKQVTVREASEAIQATPAAVLFGVGKLEDAFTLAEGGKEDDIYWAEATPKSPDSGFDRIRVGFRHTLPVAMDVVDAFGQVNRFEFTNIKVKVDVPDSLFEFTPPAGVDVLE